MAWVNAEADPSTLPPILPVTCIPRRRLDEALRAVLARRLTCVVAERGYGKSWMLATLASRVNCAWYSVPDDVELPMLVGGIARTLASRVHGFPAEMIIGATIGARRQPEGDATRAQALAGLICRPLREQLTGIVLVIDNLDRVAAETDCAVLIEAITLQAPPSLNVVLSGRSEPPFAVERMRRRGDLLDLTAADLVFTTDEVELLLRRAAPEVAGHAEQVHERTGGWPAVIGLIADLLIGTEPSDRIDVLETVMRRDVDLATYLAEHVLASLRPEVLRLFRTVAHVGPITPALCTALDVEVGPEELRSLAGRGLFVEHSAQSGWFALSPLIGGYVGNHLAHDDTDMTAQLAAASEWFATHGHPGRAVDAALRAGHADRLAALVEEHGDQLLASRDARTLLAVADALPDEHIDERMARVFGDAALMRSRLDEATAWFERAGAQRVPTPAGVAWRAAFPLVARSALPLALAALERVALDGDDPREEAILLAWRSYVRRALGDAASSDDDAESSLRCAEVAADDLALAAAQAMCGLAAASQGRPSSAQAHWHEAVAHAERVGDALWSIRSRTLLATHWVTLDRHDDALAEIDTILDLAEATGLNDARAQALVLRATVRYVRGALDEAVADLRRAIDLYEALGSDLGIGPAPTAGPWRLLGDTLRARGTLVAARDAYERAVAAAGSGASIITRSMCLAALARGLADVDPSRAATSIEAATANDAGAANAYVRIAAAAVALAAGDAARAVEHAHRASEIAAANADRSSVALATEALAVATSDPEERRRYLEEALAIWRELDAPIEGGRVSIALAAVLPSAEAAAMAASALAMLRRVGARRLADDAAAVLRKIELDEHPPVHIRTLGGFSVVRYGVEVPISGWQSRKARDLVKHLVVRRGSAATREALMDALWPDDDPAKIANRLSVALSTVRGVLDPEKRFPADHFIRADHSSVALDLEHVSIDVESFLADAARGLGPGADTDEAATLLGSAEERYAGDFLEEDAYEEWAVTLREHARTTYVTVAHALAQRSAQRDDHGSAIRYALRILERDPFDERAHLRLVGSLEHAGHHGEARRCYRMYCERMAEIGVEASPFPSRPVSRATAH